MTYPRAIINRQSMSNVTTPFKEIFIDSFLRRTIMDGGQESRQIQAPTKGYYFQSKLVVL